MLRIWKGPEMEGADLDRQTLFICSDRKLNLDQIIDMIQKNSDISKIYLGAGREAFLGFINPLDDFKFSIYCRCHKLKLTIETEVNYLDNLCDYFTDAEIILTIRTKNWKINKLKDIKLKLDDYDIARIYNNTSYFDTDLKTVVDNRYTCDTIIYEEV